MTKGRDTHGCTTAVPRQKATKDDERQGHARLSTARESPVCAVHSTSCCTTATTAVVPGAARHLSSRAVHTPVCGCAGRGLGQSGTKMRKKFSKLRRRQRKIPHGETEKDSNMEQISSCCLPALFFLTAACSRNSNSVA